MSAERDLVGLLATKPDIELGGNVVLVCLCRERLVSPPRPFTSGVIVTLAKAEV